MMNTLSKMRNASRVRNRTATMIAAFMFGMVTLYSRWNQVAPSTCAASCMSSGTWARPASSSSEMNGVVFQISEKQITAMDGAKDPNQSVVEVTQGNQANHWLTNPVSVAKANCQAKAETTVMIA